MLKKSKGRNFGRSCAFFKHRVYCVLVLNQFVLLQSAQMILSSKRNEDRVLFCIRPRLSENKRFSLEHKSHLSYINKE